MEIGLLERVWLAVALFAVMGLLVASVGGGETVQGVAVVRAHGEVLQCAGDRRRPGEMVCPDGRSMEEIFGSFSSRTQRPSQ